MNFPYKPEHIAKLFDEFPSPNVRIRFASGPESMFVKITLKGIQEALAEWKVKIVSDPDSVSSLGLCSVIRNYYINRGEVDAITEDEKKKAIPFVSFTHDLFDRTAVFLPEGIVPKATTMFPFGGGNTFHTEHSTLTMHKNVQRLAWADAVLKA